jgi:hypothetical protein
MKFLYVVALVLISGLYFGSLPVNPVVPFTSQHIALPKVDSAIHIQHTDRTKSGGFSSMWIDKNCENLVFISDYSQAEQLDKLDQQVIRSQWFHSKLVTNSDGTLKEINYVRSGRVRQPNGEFLLGATESMTIIPEGILTSLDDRGDLWLYPYLKPEDDLAHVEIEQVVEALKKKPQVWVKQKNHGKGNAGLESITSLKTGEVFALWEKHKMEETHTHANLIGYPTVSSLPEYPAVSTPKDVATLLNGDLIVLEKDWLHEKGSRLRLVLLDGKALAVDRKYKQTVLFDHI